MPGIAGAIENERFMTLRGARVLSRRNSPLAKARKSAPEAAESVIQKLKEEIARGHDTVAFIITFSFGLFKDFGIDGMRVITRMAVEASTRGTTSMVSTGLNIASVAAPYVGGAIGCAIGGAGGTAVGGAAGSVVPVAGTAAGAVAGAATGCGAGTAQGTAIGVWVGRGLEAVAIGAEYIGGSIAVSSGRAVDLTFLCISLMVSAGIYVLMWGKGWMIKPGVKFAWWGAGFFIDNLPKINFLPLTTISIAYAWFHVKKRAKAAEKKLADIEKLTQNEIEDLDQDISILDKER